MPEALRYRVGSATLVRVLYFDVGLDPLGLKLDPAALAGHPWTRNGWVNDNGQVMVGQAVWVIESGGQRIVVDPCGAADAFIRTGPDAITHQVAVLDAMRAAGQPPEDIDLVVLSHLDGIGLTALVDEEGAWSPAFPKARVLMTATELDFLSTAHDVLGLSAFRQLRDQGVVDGVGATHRCTDEVTMVETGGHSPGHAVVRVESNGEAAVFIGHLAVTPAYVPDGWRPGFHHDSVVAKRAFDDLLTDAAARRALVAGPLWPSPGVGHVAVEQPGGAAAAPGWVVTPALA